MSDRSDPSIVDPDRHTLLCIVNLTDKVFAYVCGYANEIETVVEAILATDR